MNNSALSTTHSRHTSFPQDPGHLAQISATPHAHLLANTSSIRHSQGVPTTHALRGISASQFDESDEETMSQSTRNMKANIPKSSKHPSTTSTPQTIENAVSMKSKSQEGRGKGKGKAKAKPLQTASQRKSGNSLTVETTKGKRGGRKPGASSYYEKDLTHLVALVGDVLPTGGQGWTAVAERYNLYATANGRTERTDKSLRKKFQEVYII